MKRTDAWVSQNNSSDSMERSNSVSHLQAAESLHEISVNTPTLRDQFAMSALQGMLTTAGGPCLHGLDGIELQTATAAYRLADAMLEARK